MKDRPSPAFQMVAAPPQRGSTKLIPFGGNEVNPIFGGEVYPPPQAAPLYAGEIASKPLDGKRIAYIFKKKHRNVIRVPYLCTAKPKKPRGVARLARLLWEQEVASSNLATPTIENQPLTTIFVSGFFIASQTF